jgi:hypothetical protein
MAGIVRVRALSIDCSLFLGVLLLRFFTDWFRFPVDGYDNLRVVDALEYLSFYVTLQYSIYIMLRLNGIEVVFASRLAVATITVYMLLHFLEFFAPAGGRAKSYAPSEHLLINVVSGFLLTDDVGFWQLMRLPVCGAMLVMFLWRQRISRLRLLLSMGVLYFWGMLLVHPGAWLFLPEDPHLVPAPVMAAGLPNLITCAWFLLFVTLAARVERHLAYPSGASPGAFSSLGQQA